MNLDITYLVLWVVFFGFMILLLTVFLQRRKRATQYKRDREQYIDDLKSKYTSIDSEKIDEIKDEDLVGVIVLICQEKEENDEEYFEKLNDVERTIYGIYCLNETLSGSTGLKSFFDTPALDDYVPIIDKCYENVGAYDIAELMRYARRLHEILTNNLDDEDMGDYSTFNFSDFTNEYMSLIAGTKFESKVIQYIRDNKHLFDEEKELEDENISE